jgi:glycosyltransferase involved in cell wall biosynthesis
MPATFAKADLLFAALKDEPVFSLTVPAKIQAYMSAGKPIVTMINGEAKELVEGVGCGIAVGAGDAEAFAEAVLNIAQMSSEEREELGRKARDFSAKHFNFVLQMDRLEEIIKNE